MSSQAGQPGVYASTADALLQLLNILIQKGDLLTRDGSGNLVRVPVGLDGQQLTANSADPNGIDWQAGTVAPVDTVFGRVGNVVAALSDYDASQVDNDSGVAGATVKDALDALLAAIPSVPVASVFGRVGAVVAALSDYDASQVDNDSGVAGATVKDALDALAAALLLLDLVPGDKDLVGLVTAADGQKATNSTISNTPSGYVMVTVNGLLVTVGDGVKTTECYFSGDGGTTARTISAIVAGDELYWNGSIAGYQLDTSDLISFNYQA